MSRGRPDEDTDNAFFQRESRRFAREARSGAALLSARGKQRVMRALAICGKPTLMPRFSYDIATLAALLAYEVPQFSPKTSSPSDNT